MNSLLLITTLSCFASSPSCLTAEHINKYSKIYFEYYGVDDNDYCAGEVYATCQSKKIYLSNFVFPSWKLDDSENIKYELEFSEHACSAKGEKFNNIELVGFDSCVNKLLVVFDN